MDSRLFLIPIVLVVLAVTEVDNRNFLYRNFSEEDLKGYHSPLYALIFCVIAFVVMMFLFPSHNKDYQEIKDKYDELSASVDIAREDAITIKWYFTGQENITKEEAESSLNLSLIHI